MRLSTAQIYALAVIRDCGVERAVPSIVAATTLRSLCRRGLARVEEPVAGRRVVALTDAGRAALANWLKAAA
jgi:DNA-binding MarR family transcriptional regulator